MMNTVVDAAEGRRRRKGVRLERCSRRRMPAMAI